MKDIVHLDICTFNNIFYSHLLERNFICYLNNRNKILQNNRNYAEIEDVHEYKFASFTSNEKRWIGKVGIDVRTRACNRKVLFLHTHARARAYKRLFSFNVLYKILDVLRAVLSYISTAEIICS